MLSPDMDTTGDGRRDDAMQNETGMRQPSAPKRSHMTRQKAGQRGGLTTAKRHGKEFYEKIGRKGGQSRKKKERDGVGV